MLALCCGSRQVVVADEELDGTDMMGELLGKRQRLTYQARHALAQRIVEALDVIGFAGQLTDRQVLRRGNHPFVYHILIGVKRGMLTVRFWNLPLQVFRTPAAAIPLSSAKFERAEKPLRNRCYLHLQTRQLSIDKPGIRRQWFTFSVTMTRVCFSAVAAMRISASLMRWPSW
jgi:hypothetical protein